MWCFCIIICQTQTGQTSEPTLSLMLMSAPLDRSSFTWSTCLYSVAQIMAVQPPSSWQKYNTFKLGKLITDQLSKAETSYKEQHIPQTPLNKNTAIFPALNTIYIRIWSSTFTNFVQRFIQGETVSLHHRCANGYLTARSDISNKATSDAVQFFLSPFVPQLAISDLVASKCIWRTHPNDTEHLNTHCTTWQWKSVKCFRKCCLFSVSTSTKPWREPLMASQT